MVRNWRRAAGTGLRPDTADEHNATFDVGWALAAPLLAQFTGTASGATAAGTLGTVSEGRVEVRLTPQAQTQLDRLQAVAKEVAPAQVVKAHRPAVSAAPTRRSPRPVVRLSVPIILCSFGGRAGPPGGLRPRARS